MSTTPIAAPTATSGAVPTAPAAPPGPVFGPRLAVGMAGILLAAMVAGLNARVPALALPDTRGALGLGPDEASWLSTAYTAGELAVMPFATWFAVTFSLRRFHGWMLVSTLLLALLLPFVHELSWLLPLRLLHGLVSGALIPMLMMAALRFLPTPIRLHGLALYALTATFAPNVALWIATQWLDRLVDWRWAYWHLVPLGLLALALAQWGIPRMPPALPRLGQANWPGMALGAPGLMLLTVGLDQGQRLDWLQSPLIVAALTAGGLLTSLFLLSEWFHPGPFIKLQLLGRRNLGLGFVVFFLLLVSMSSGVALPSLDLTVQHGFRVEQLVPLGLVVGLPQLVLGPLVALLLYQRRVDARHLFALGLVLIAAACWTAARVDVDWMAPQFLTAQMLQAVGQPLAVVSLLFLSTSVVQPMEGPFVSGIVNTLRACGTLVGGAFVSHQMSERSSFHAEVLLGDLGRRLGQGLDAAAAIPLGPLLGRHASVLAVADVYRMLGLLALLLIPLVLMLQHIPAPMATRPTAP
ncbi:DHA2 family multidrug resistance protein [Sphaerotilus hippei]|uniref:DHA2 family multidrug resistance protein n=1 Tax=Sphaerotilus hippei TaxID=744406 RepID=A0A318GUB8_9BURK|nr:MFS transporter [Sphaerotilus hippei]PXW92288.1 DHA2 family multidrug resistance protein [Sphaerotilus hippei]